MAAQQDPPKQRCSEVQKALFAAAREGDVDGCRRLLSTQDVRANDVVHALSGGTALHAGIALAQRSSPGGSNPLQRRPRGYRYSRG